MTCEGSKRISTASASTLVSYAVRLEEGRGRRTASFASADDLVAGVVEVAARVPDLGVDEALAGEVLAVEVLGAPEAAGGDGAALGGCAACAAVRGEGEAGGVGEGADEACEEGR